jgi:hypothetical protein
MSKGAKKRKPERDPESDAEVDLPFGYLETADPPRKNIVSLAIAAVALVVWMAALLYLAFGSP